MGPKQLNDAGDDALLWSYLHSSIIIWRGGSGEADLISSGKSGGD